YYGMPMALLWLIGSDTVSIPLDAALDIHAFGIIVSLVIFCVGFTPRGSRINAATVLIQIVLTYAYMWYLLNGGVIDFVVQNISLHFEFRLIMYWILAIAAINALPYVGVLLNPKVKS
ncbi:MAG: hypothetical protein ACTSVM_03250, partial [Candidatus Ranarchaeia archaeon]